MNKKMVAPSQNMGRLNKQVIEWMGADAESDLTEDDAQKEKIEARNQLENFCHLINNIVESRLGRREHGREIGEQGCVEEWD